MGRQTVRIGRRFAVRASYNFGMEASRDVLVIGGGIIGLTTAVELAAAGLSVEVCDAALPGQASWAGAGIIPPGNLEHAVTPLDRLRAFSSQRFQELPEDVKNDIGYRRNGAVIFEESDVVEMWQREGITVRGATVRECDFSAHSLTVVPRDAYLLPDMAQVRNPRFLKHLRRHCERLGVRLTQAHTTVEQIEEKARYCVIASGAWSERLLAGLGCPLDIHPVKGQMLLFHSQTHIPSETLIDGKRYIVPRGDGHVLVGSTEEPGFEVSTTAEALAGLHEFAGTYVPALRELKPMASWAGLRPGSRDGLPYIGVVPGHDKVLAAVGHFRSGIQLSLGTATMIADLILERTPVVDPTPFRLDRPLHPPMQLAFRS